MKPTTYLINTARGPADRRVRPGPCHRRRLDCRRRHRRPRTGTATPQPSADRTGAGHRHPHAAFLSEESLLELERRAALSVVRVLQGRMPEYVWNREVLERVSLAEE